MFVSLYSYIIQHRLLYYSTHIISIAEENGAKKYDSETFHTGETTGVMTLTNKKLEKIPKKIFTMGNLRVLDISNNKLKMLPQEMSVLKNLKTLKLNDNYCCRQIIFYHIF